MTKDEAIRKARDEEREKVARWIISMTLTTGHGDTLEDLLKELEWQIEEMREKIRLLESQCDLRSGKLVVPMTVEQIETVLKQFEEHDDHTEQVFNFMLIKQQAKAIHTAQLKTKGE